LNLLGVFGDLSQKTYKNDDERIFFVIKKDWQYLVNMLKLYLVEYLL
jgi:hypothetical protein